MGIVVGITPFRIGIKKSSLIDKTKGVLKVPDESDNSKINWLSNS